MINFSVPFFSKILHKLSVQCLFPVFIFFINCSKVF